MLIGSLSCLEGGGLALLQPGGLGTTPIVYEYNKDSIYSSTVLSRFRILSLYCTLHTEITVEQMND